ncbi:hypothetical protein EVAR_65284_1 [Eumeta japonica]|uniref:Uncharacterized protein n=1 Tax=Eumeta variegata TaxID=151549 RepID=A0A4C1ZK93_EUMVA|nr:hypothetical protein EVAR_65284_1 [Eumeta japonica]
MRVPHPPPPARAPAGGCCFKPDGPWRWPIQQPLRYLTRRSRIPSKPRIQSRNPYSALCVPTQRQMDFGPGRTWILKIDTRPATSRSHLYVYIAIRTCDDRTSAWAQTDTRRSDGLARY